MSVLPFDWRYRILLSSPMFAEISVNEEWKLFKKAILPQALEYPDGSIEFESDDLSEEKLEEWNQFFQIVFDETLKKRRAEGRDAGREGFQTHMRSIHGFRENLFVLWYPDSFQRGLGDQSLLIVPEEWTDVTNEEKTHSCFQISILLMKMPDERSRRRLGSVFKEWVETVSVQGIHGEGAVQLSRNSIEWRGRVARFVLDISKSGQSTLNWLILWLVSNAQDVPIEMIALGNSGGPIFENPLREKPVFEALG